MTSIVGFIKDAFAPSTQLVINLKQTVFWEGDMIEGEVGVMSMEYPFHANLRIEVNGVVEGTTHAFKVNVREIFFSKDIQLLEGEITQRHQSFPFSFSLPHDCPNSFYVKRRNDFGTIYYYVRATLKVPYRLDQQIREKITVREKQKSITSPIRALGRLHVWMDRNMYFPGDRVIARLKIRNNLDFTPPPVRMRLVRTIEFRASESFAVEAYGIDVDPPPSFFYGTMWTSFNLPLKLELSSSGSVVSLNYWLQFDASFVKSVLTIPIKILARQELQTLHPMAPPDAILPPPTLFRPVHQSNSAAPFCNLCGVEFSVLKLKTHCRHCGKIFCSDCTNAKTPIKKLKFHEPAKVCRPCMRVVEETGGVKFQTTKQVIEEWSKSPEVNWVPKCSKQAFNWKELQVPPPGKCFSAISPNQV